MDDFFRLCVENGVTVRLEYIPEFYYWELTLHKGEHLYRHRFERSVLGNYYSNLNFTTIMIDILEKFIKEVN